ncbi:MAG: alpha/beta hydrolase [Alphaproteobacteria bacterium]|nr:alpha/beta hydrolase [Alphaproteobacteria bacterium]
MIPEKLNEFRKRFKARDIPGGRFIWQVWGAHGPSPVLMLPGAQGTGEIFYRPALALAQAGLSPLSVTMPETEDVEALVQSLAAMLDMLELEKVDIVGTSLGSYIAQRFALDHSTRVRKLVVGNGFSDATEVQSTRYDPDVLAATDAENLKSMMLGRIQAGPDGELRNALLEVMGRTQPASTLKARALTVAKSIPITEPPLTSDRVLIIDSDPDPVLGDGLRDTQLALYPGAKHIRIENGTHYPYLAVPEIYVPALVEWLE